MRLLLISPFPYGPRATHGGAVACYAQLITLLKQHQIGIVFFANANSDSAHITYLNTTCQWSQFVELKLNRLTILRARIQSLLSQKPIDALLHQSSAMELEIQKAISQFIPDLVIFQFPQMAQYVSVVQNTPCLIDVQDAFSVSGFRVWNALPAGFKKIDKLLNWLFWIKYETNFYSKAKAVITLTTQDLLGLKIFQPKLKGQTLYPPLSIPAGKRLIEKIRPLQIGFVGSFSHEPNVGALHHFIDEILPLIHQINPNIEFHIAGKNPPPSLLEKKTTLINFHGFVDDLSLFINQCAVMVIPLLSGGGIKIKTLEALAHAAPVISTSLGVEGIAAVDGTHLLIRDEPLAFAKAVIDLLENQTFSSKLGCAGQDLVLETFNSTKWLKDFNNLAKQLIDNS